MKVIVSCGDIKLKVSLTEKTLSRSLHDAVLSPFLAAYNKKTSNTLDISGVDHVEIDGVSWSTGHCVKLESRDVLRGTEPRVIIVPSSTSAGAGAIATGGVNSNTDIAALMSSLGTDPASLSSMMQSMTRASLDQFAFH